VARQLAGATLFEFTQAFAGTPESSDKTFLREVIAYMVSRDS